MESLFRLQAREKLHQLEQASERFGKETGDLKTRLKKSAKLCEDIKAAVVFLDSLLNRSDFLHGILRDMVVDFG